MSKNKKTPFSSKIANGYKRFDQYGQTVNFSIQGEDSHKSLIGAFVSSVIMLLLGAYSFEKLRIMIDRGDTDLTKVTAINEDVKNSSEYFTYEQTKFAIAFGVYDVNQVAVTEEEMYGYLDWQISSFYVDSSTEFLEYTPISHHYCSQDDYEKYFKREDLAFLSSFDGNLHCLDNPE